MDSTSSWSSLDKDELSELIPPSIESPVLLWSLKRNVEDEDDSIETVPNQTIPRHSMDIRMRTRVKACRLRNLCEVVFFHCRRALVAPFTNAATPPISILWFCFCFLRCFFWGRGWNTMEVGILFAIKFICLIYDQTIRMKIWLRWIFLHIYYFFKIILYYINVLIFFHHKN